MPVNLPALPFSAKSASGAAPPPKQTANREREYLRSHEEDVVRLSPLGYKHINMLGRYQFALPEHLQQGELRPLRAPNDTLEAEG